jgi:hypothetical protein
MGFKGYRFALALCACFQGVLGLGALEQTSKNDITIKEGTVYSVALTTDLRSRVSKVGDKFTAKLLTDGQKPYAGLPFGTVVYGKVSYVKPLEGDSPGLLELSFEGFETPLGNRFPISAQLIETEGSRFVRQADGSMSVLTKSLPNRTIFTGYGKTSRKIVGLRAKGTIMDAALPRLAATEVGAAARKGFTDEVQLPPDTQFGMVLLKPLKIPKDVL